MAGRRDVCVDLRIPHSPRRDAGLGTALPPQAQIFVKQSRNKYVYSIVEMVDHGVYDYLVD